MDHPLIYDRGRGPELRTKRLTVYDLIPYLLSPHYSDGLMSEAWPSISPEELAALKAYIADRLDEVMAEHYRIEGRIRRGIEAQNAPEFQARFWWTRERMEAYRDWIADRERAGALPPVGERRGVFRAWYEARTAVGVAG